MLILSSRCHIPDQELQFQTMRAQGAGGQHVNKTDSAVWLRFDYRASPTLPDHYKEGLDRLRDSRVHDGFILIRSECHRSQEMNRQEARERLLLLLKKAAERPKARHATRPTCASQVRRVDAKKRKGAIKAGRRAPMGD
ncbi:alternative ribosome rescue aminoacyl-tRNA hydrolase ArfB [Aeromonas schubertii]|uniref:alternative ribosome rescue aminoacyl-tRNA hydrolase ArfB n=1 Tax=Aeromonas schubertii TaxID=652 RepID=UPI0010A91DD9|nr:alternative ribosome rescue aminoacyl-tRNA hydrolase ArfB [Aeromonas schubertii]QCG46750.1 aminoacyl-tRNA hydrolase [Aeromonas schubertii]